MMLTAERLRELLDYDEAAGVFRWKVARGPCATGDVAGSVNKLGYRQICVDGRLYRASRLAWLYAHGHWPTWEIDHKNTVPGDDRFKNLRDTTRTVNNQNLRRAKIGSKTGLLGVSPYRGKFRAEITVDWQKHRLGTFSTPEAAHVAYLKAKRRLHPGCTI